MKTLTIVAVAAALYILTVSAQAAEQAEHEVSLCVEQLQARFEDGTEFQLVEKRRHMHGTKLRIAARLDHDNAYFATCWVARTQASELVEGTAYSQWAVTIPPLQLP